MFDYIKGKITSIHSQRVTIEANGIGYLVIVPATFVPKQETTTLFTSFIVREDSQTLYGFVDSSERDFFNALINVQGIGPKTALAIVGNITISDLSIALQKKDVLSLCKVPGIGKKTAERLLIELKDLSLHFPHSPLKKDDPSSKLSKDAISALMNLGYTQHTAQSAVQKALENSPKDLPELITLSLKSCK
jgi:Holliday junction DNA helicase RuvA